MPALFRSRRFWLISVGALALLGGGLWYGSQAKAKKVEAAKVAAATPATPYGAVADGKADVEGGVIAVAARRQGIVAQVFVQEGDVVQKGQPLAKQEDDDVRLAAETAAANLAQARAQIRVLEVKKTTAQREFARLQGLAASNFVAGQRLDQARDAIAGADAELGAQRAMVATYAAQLNQARYNQELTVIRAPADGRIARRYANPGSGASTLNVTSMFDLEPSTARIIRAEISESAIPFVSIGQSVEIIPEADQTKVFTGKVLRRAAMFGARKLQSDDPSERTDARVVEVVVSADDTPFLIGQRVLVKFMKPGQIAGAKRSGPQSPDPAKS
ncbi:MAG: HlyD family efflux transporter periplasmic adaptor subunit [Caulobacter sp.]